MKTFYSFLTLLGILSLTKATAQAPVMGPITGPSSSCSAPSAPKSYSVTATNSPTSYMWVVMPMTAGVVIGNASAAVTTISFPYLGTGTQYTIACTATNGSGMSMSSVNYVVDVFETPTVTFSGANSFCQGSSTNLSASPTIMSASSTLSYNWSPATGLSSTTNYSVNASPATNTTYTVLLTIGSCTNTQQVSVSVNPLCNYVWPGDVNNDGVANNMDVLELGLHFSQAGPQRLSYDNSWQAFYADAWTGLLSNGKNMNNANCNGDSIIDLSDTAAIFLNYGLTHPKAAQTAVDPLLSVVSDQTFVNQGAWGSASVYLGSASTPISNINGLAFTVDFDESLIEPNSFYIVYPTSFLNTGNQSLKFSKLNYASGSLYTAMTHTNNVNVSGNGKIATIHYRINTNLSSTAPLTISLSQVNQSNASGALTPLSAGSASVNAISTGIREMEASNSAVYPNPASQQIFILSKTALEKIELMSVTGKLMFSETVSGNSYQLDATQFANGVYFLSIYSADQKIERKKIIVQH